MRSDDHHMIPTSLGGLKHPVNIKTLQRDRHEYIHGVMNYQQTELFILRKVHRVRHPKRDPYWYYDERKVKAMLVLQRGYYEKFVRLECPNLREMHIDKLNALVWFHLGYKLPYSNNFNQLWQLYANAVLHYYANLE